MLALSGGTKWSAATGTPVTDIRAAAEVIRKKAGVRPNKLLLSADALAAIVTNAEVQGYLPSTQMKPATIDQLKTLFNVAAISVGDAIWVDSGMWLLTYRGNNASSAIRPISAARHEPGAAIVWLYQRAARPPVCREAYYSDETSRMCTARRSERKVNFSKTGCLIPVPELQMLNPPGVPQQPVLMQGFSHDKTDCTGPPK